MSNLFEKDGHTIHHGDAITILRAYIPDSSVDLIFADPPYNIGKKFANFHDRWFSDEEYSEWSYQWLEECIRVLKPSGSLYVMTSTQAMPYFDIFLRKRLHILSRIVWHYDSSGVQAKKHFGSIYEPILYCVKDPQKYVFNSEDIKVEAKTGAQRKLIDYRKPVPTPYNTTKVPGNVWNFPRVRYRMFEYEEHPSQKPEDLLERIVKASSNLGDLVLDPFGGSFTTCAVAKRLGRRSIGIESQLQYIKIGLRRVLDLKEINGESLHPPVKTYVRKKAFKNDRKMDIGEVFHALSET
ncbi:adenine-specific DNA-methyltransferase [Argonema galeatum]|uniref:adenine-specific DNA-methyltransferase n=1 Tax=Argonema galeatum TaxID=2942762 RepID=UPI00201340E0|nr:adenine-specific DNA-methyltransferase [Argonema galeatum]MCL1464826.1 adenine-specific DNA-methyltransferase [Argonema galeatum A003/A1]